MSMPTQLTSTQNVRMARARLVTEAQIAQAAQLVDQASFNGSDRSVLMAAVLHSLATNYLAEVTKAA